MKERGHGLLCVGALILIAALTVAGAAEEEPAKAVEITSAPVQTVRETKTARPYETFIVTVQPTEAPKRNDVRYQLTPEERQHIERVVMGEAGNQGTEGQMLVAQCILNACEKDGIRPMTATDKYSYAGYSEDVTESVKNAVANVFDAGENVTDEPILYFYAPKATDSAWHESQDFVIEHKDHRFFKEANV